MSDKHDIAEEFGTFTTLSFRAVVGRRLVDSISSDDRHFHLHRHHSRLEKIWNTVYEDIGAILHYVKLPCWSLIAEIRFPYLH